MAALREANDADAVAHESGRLLGVASVVRCALLHRELPVALLTALVVRSDVRGRGVGRRLVRAVDELAVPAMSGPA